MAGMKRKNEEPHTSSMNTPEPPSDITTDSPPKSRIVTNRLNVFAPEEGTISDGDTPSHKYSLGGDIFLVVGVFRRRTYIHIRRYKKFGSVNYPTKEGVSLTPQQFLTLTEAQNEDAGTLDVILADSSQLHELRVQMGPTQLNDSFPYADRQFLFTRTINTFCLETNQICESRSTSITISDMQWHQLFTHRTAVIESTIAVLYADANIIREYELISRRYVRPLYDQTRIPDATLAEARLREIFSSAVYNRITATGFKPRYICFDLCILDKKAEFNLCLLNLNFTEVIEDFHSRVINEPPMSNVRGSVGYYATMDFFLALNPLDIISEIRYDMCELNL